MQNRASHPPAVIQKKFVSSEGVGGTYGIGLWKISLVGGELGVIVGRSDGRAEGWTVGCRDGEDDGIWLGFIEGAKPRSFTADWLMDWFVDGDRV